MKVFAADGRLYQIEYAIKAAQSCGQTSIAIRANDSVVVCTEKKVPDAMIVPDSVTHIFNVADDIGAVIIGNMNDARYIVQMLRYQASNFKFKNAYEIPVHVLASMLAKQMQWFSQHQGVRSSCVIVTLVGCDVERGPQVYKIDPSGQSCGFKATAAGAKEQEAITQLEKQFKKTEGNWGQKEAVETAIKVLQAVVNSDFKATDIEVGFASVQQPKFRKMQASEIE